ncbi:S8 family serine peptidase [Flammeovirga sp. MY04]|uniref:S8 family serine peptidase n=1 Tax=Flammeovirga sp. MY04 TaxID=1191459 RepID=UPI0008061600|nr:S8 family serine peptidase [Flammeovirga sp. MY04]ANQ51476.1 S8 family serine peptidase [Flammeovirga sp. MY04]
MMKKLHLLAILLLLSAVGLQVKAQQMPGVMSFNQKGEAQGYIRVKFKPQVQTTLQIAPMNALGVSKLGIADFDAVAQQYHAHNMKRVFPFDARFEHKLQRHGLHLWYDVEVDANVSPQQVVESFKHVADVELAEVRLEKHIVGKGSATVVQPEAFNEEGPTTNDPLFNQQWHYHNTGDRSGWLPESSIQLLEAWKITQGTSNVIVSVHDEGVDTDHEDLRPNLWINEAEMNGEAGVDDDGNGYVDDYYGYNFAFDRGELDPQEHGTHVAGTIGAVTNNGKGVAGIAGGTGNGDGVRIMPLQIIGGPNNNTAASFIYAANNGAVISQNSWGYTQAGAYEQAVLDAIDYFIEEAGDYEGAPMKGGIVIFASGNSDIDAQMYPGYYNKVMAVAATGPSKKKAYYSNYGEWIDITAPGGDLTYGNQDAVLSTLPNNQYGFLQGTSMACPHVSGTAALILSAMGGDHMTPDILWNQLVASSRNIDDDNFGFTGKLGAGLLDAGLAVIENQGDAPNAITDLMITGASNNFVRLSWTVPTDEDDGAPSKFEILYNEGEAVTESATSMIVFSDSAANTTYEYELYGLEDETTYAFTVIAYDRWGNTSEVSNQIVGTTNLGPEIETTASWTTINVYADESMTATHQHIIKNNADGILKWKGKVRNTYQYKSSSYSVPTVGTVQSTPRNMAFDKQEKLEVYSTKEDPSVLQPYENKYKEYVSSIYASMVVGEEDLSLSNSTASAFIITEEEGFNLTEVEVYLGDITTGEAVVEVYRGPILSQAEKVLSKGIDSKSQGLKRVQAEGNEHIFFPQGEVMWIVTKVPAGNQYPIGINNSNEIEDSEFYQWMSFDDGKTWQPINSTFGFGGYSFCVAGVSKDPHYGNFITMSPESGEINGVGEQEITFTVDISKMPGGYVNMNAIFESNDTQNPEVRSPYQVYAYNHESNIITPNIVEVGGVQIGYEKDFIVALHNFGYGGESGIYVDLTTLEGTNFSMPSAQSWDISSGRKWFGSLNPRATVDLELRYTPTVGGNDNAVVRLYNSSGWEHTFAVTGFGIEPSEIDVAPEQITYTHTIGESGNGSVTISNAGNFPLEFIIPKYSSETSDNDHQFGYSWERIDTDAPETEDWKWDELVGAEDVIDYTPEFKANPFLDFVKVDLGFQFPFYDTLLTEMYLSHVGMIAVDEKDPVNGSFGSLLGRSFTSNGYIAFLYEYMDWGLNSKILYKKFDDRVVAQYEQMLPKQANGRSDIPMTFQVALYYNGNIEMRYKDMGWGNATATDPFVGIESPDKQDGFYIYEFIRKPEKLFEDDYTEVMVKVNHPGPNIIHNLSKTEGLVPVGSSVEITYDVQTDNLVEGLNTQNIAIISNDPIEPISHFTVNVDIIDGGVSNIETSSKEVNLGSIYRTADVVHNINFVNNGSALIDFTSTVIDGGIDSKFSVDKSVFQLLPRLGTTVKVALDTEDVGTYSEVITFNDADGGTHVFNITATIIDEPQIELDTTPMDITLAAGEKTTVNVTVSNANGKADLEVLPNGAVWMYETTAEAMDVAPLKDFTYAWRDNKKQLDGLIDPNAPVFQWEAIDETWEKVTVQDTYMLWEPYDLPFTFDFWEDGYDKIWIGYNGIMTFTEPTVPSPLFSIEIPNAEEEPHNFIASLWSLTGEDYYDEHPLKGIWVKHDEEKIIITYNRYIHNWGFLGGYVSAQTILYKNGTIKTQYKTIDQEAVEIFNKYFTLGLENKDGTDGVVNNFYLPYITDGLAVEYTPSKKTVIPAGEEKTFTFTVDATDLLGGTYNHYLSFTNKTPGKENITIPVTLTVNGSADFTWQEDVIDLGDIVYTENMWLQPEFTLHNNGTGDLYFNKESIVADAALNLELFTQVIVEDTGLEEGPHQWYNWETIFKWKEICDGPVIWGGCLGDLITVEGEYHYLPPMLAPKTEVLARVTLMPQTAGAYEKVIKYVVGEEEKMLTIKANFYEPAKFAMENVIDLHVDAVTADHQETMDITFNNTEGKSILDWEVMIEFIASGFAPKEEITAFATNSSTRIASVDAPVIPQVYSGINEADYHQVLSYDDHTSPSNSIGFGNASLTTITKFVAPLEGFKLSDVTTWFTPKGTISEGDIIVTVLTGSIDNPVELASESFTMNFTEMEETGGLVNFELTEDITFFNGDNIFVGITYPEGVAYPQGVARVEERIAGTFFVPTSNGWEDLTATAQFEKSAYMVRLMSKEAIDGSWLSISESEGQTAMGEETTLSLSFDATYNRGRKDVAAKVTILTNDPNHEGTSFYASMHTNQGPMYTTEMDAYSLLENDTLIIKVGMHDEEGDEFTTEVMNLGGMGTTSIEGDTLTITLTPNFDMSGNYELIVKGEDAHGAESEKSIALEVIDVNRAPIAFDMEAMELATGEVYYIDPSALFMDEDGDELTYQVADNGNGVLIAGLADGQFVISSLKEGVSDVAFMATDPSGLSAIITVDVTVGNSDDITSIDPSEANNGLQVYPNPVNTNTTFEWEMPQNGVVTVVLHNLQGQQIDLVELGQLSSGHQKMDYDAEQLPRGVYIYSLIINGELTSFGKIIKQ